MTKTLRTLGCKDLIKKRRNREKEKEPQNILEHETTATGLRVYLAVHVAHLWRYKELFCVVFERVLMITFHQNW